MARFDGQRGNGPRRVMAAALLVLGFSACARKPHYEPGCYLNSAVKPATRRELEGAVNRFYDLLRSRRYEEAYGEAADALRTRVDKNQVAQAWTSISEILTIPREVKTEEVAVAVFPEGTRGPQQVQCVDPADTTGNRAMLTTDQPFQAYLIQSAEVNGTIYNFASIWFFEEGKWKLATFGAKPRKQLGHDWRYFLDLARSQKQKGNARNAALLYNLSMDLLVPAPWVKPAMLQTLQAEQRTIRVENLPAGRKLEWVAQDGTVFNTYMVSYEITPQGLAIRFQYEVPAPIDTTAVAAKAPVLANFVRTSFPEYPEVFSEILLEATTPVDHQPVWAGTFSFRE
jgi:hypothetical protein